MKEPLGSTTADEFILSRSNAKLFIKMLKRVGLSGQPCLTPFSHLKKICCFSLNFYCTVRVFVHAFNNSKGVSNDIKTFKF